MSASILYSVIICCTESLTYLHFGAGRGAWHKGCVRAYSQAEHGLIPQNLGFLVVISLLIKLIGGQRLDHGNQTIITVG